MKSSDEHAVQPVVHILAVQLMAFVIVRGDEYSAVACLFVCFAVLDAWLYQCERERVLHTVPRLWNLVIWTVGSRKACNMDIWRSHTRCRRRSLSLSCRAIWYALVWLVHFAVVKILHHIACCLLAGALRHSNSANGQAHAHSASRPRGTG